MKQVIPFYKEIVFKNNIASILNVSLEHEESILEGEISGNFILTGEYKIHNDTTEVESFRYKLPFTALISDDMNRDTISIDIESFSYEQIEDDVLRIDIDFSIEYEVNLEDDEVEVLEDEFDKIDREIDEILGLNKNDEERDIFVIEDVGDDKDIVVPLIVEEKEEKLEVPVETIIEETKEEISNKEEYVTYYVYVVKESDTLEQILKTYNVSLEYLKEYNDIKDIKLGDKIIIPLYDE